MGVHAAIAIDKFPRQGSMLGARVEVCFHYDPKRKIHGRVVRDDAEDPGRTIIELDDGRFVLSTECQHSMPLDEPAPRDRAHRN